MTRLAGECVAAFTAKTPAGRAWAKPRCGRVSAYSRFHLCDLPISSRSVPAERWDGPHSSGILVLDKAKEYRRWNIHG